MWETWFGWHLPLVPLKVELFPQLLAIWLVKGIQTLCILWLLHLWRAASITLWCHKQCWNASGLLPGCLLSLPQGRTWQGLLIHKMHKSSAVPRVPCSCWSPSLLGSASMVLCCFGVGALTLPWHLWLPAGFWIWGAPHPWVQGGLSGSAALFFSCSCAVVWSVPALQSLLPASSWWKVLNNSCWGFVFSFHPFGLPSWPGKFVLLRRKYSAHLQPTTAAVWVIKYGKEEGRGEKKDGI